MRISAAEVKGIWPIQYAFFDAEARLDRALMARQTAACLRHNPPGLATLGLATETSKLSTAERCQVVEWLSEDIGGACPFAVTIAEPTIEGQVEAGLHVRHQRDRR